MTKVTAVKTDDKLTVDDKITIKELEEKIDGMKADKEKKCKAAKEQLIEMLEVTADKYRTATGTAEALRILRFTYGKDDVSIMRAMTLATDMAVEATKMKQKAEGLSYAEMDKLCEDFYAQEFSLDVNDDHEYTLAFEMMRIDLCRNVGGAAEDMVGFIKRVQEEIDATGEELKSLKSKEK